MPEIPDSNKEYQKVSFKEFLQLSLWVIKYVIAIDRKNALINLIGGLINSFRALINTWIFAKLIDIVIKLASQENASMRDLYPYLLAMFAYNIVANTISYIAGASRSVLRTKFHSLSKQTIYNQIHTLGNQSLETPEVANKIHRTNMYMSDILSFFRGLQDVMNHVVSSTGAVVAVATFSPFLALGISLSVLPTILNDKKYRYMMYKHSYENTEKNRMVNGASSDLMNSRELQEININSAYGFLDKKYMDFMKWYTGISLGILKKWNITGYLYDNLSEIILYLGYVSIFTKLISHNITVGSATFYQRMLGSLQNDITNIFMMINDLMESSLRLKDIHELFKEKPSFEDGTIKLNKLSKGPEIVFDNVTFTYPRAEKPVLKNLNLKIRSGEKVAIVGHNGAGKTTMVRLLLRLYQVNEGKIQINGIGINDLEIETLYANTGVLLQEYNTYPYLTAKENIYIGKPQEPLDEVKLHLAAQSADATGFISEWPNKYDQILSERYKGGIRPSTGQWQKIAIARLFYRDSPLVIFDEPTSSIDAVSEYNIFNRIYDFFKDKTVIIISHRFSTVRNADRIIVLKDGAIIEEGSHDQLMAIPDGEYSKAFLLQAQGYVSTIATQ